MDVPKYSRGDSPAAGDGNGTAYYTHMSDSVTIVQDVALDCDLGTTPVDQCPSADLRSRPLAVPLAGGSQPGSLGSQPAVPPPQAVPPGGGRQPGSPPAVRPPQALDLLGRSPPAHVELTGPGVSAHGSSKVGGERPGVPRGTCAAPAMCSSNTTWFVSIVFGVCASVLFRLAPHVGILGRPHHLAPVYSLTTLLTAANVKHVLSHARAQVAVPTIAAAVGSAVAAAAAAAAIAAGVAWRRRRIARSQQFGAADKPHGSPQAHDRLVDRQLSHQPVSAPGCSPQQWGQQPPAMPSGAGPSFPSAGGEGIVICTAGALGAGAGPTDDGHSSPQPSNELSHHEPEGTQGTLPAHHHLVGSTAVLTPLLDFTGEVLPLQQPPQQRQDSLFVKCRCHPSNNPSTDRGRCA